ncbi:hypothetical protein D9M68_926880 [compost metagenome]
MGEVGQCRRAQAGNDVIAVGQPVDQVHAHAAEHRAGDPFRVEEGHEGRDSRAHRIAEHGSTRDVEMVEQGHRILGH